MTLKNIEKVLIVLLSGLIPLSIYLVFVHAPEEATQGLVQKIFYFHVSSAFAMYAGFGLSGVGAFLYLVKRNDFYDQASRAGMSTGLLFCTLVLLSGPIWARPIWGTFWTWDPRLTTTFVLFLLFLAVYFLRSYFGFENKKGRLIASILTLFACLDMPLVFLAVKLWRGIHPSVLGQEKNMPPEMLVALIVSNILFLVLFGVLFLQQLRINRIQDKEI